MITLRSLVDSSSSIMKNCVCILWNLGSAKVVKMSLTSTHEAALNSVFIVLLISSVSFRSSSCAGEYTSTYGAIGLVCFLSEGWGGIAVAFVKSAHCYIVRVVSTRIVVDIIKKNRASRTSGVISHVVKTKTFMVG